MFHCMRISSIWDNDLQKTQVIPILLIDNPKMENKTRKLRGNYSSAGRHRNTKTNLLQDEIIPIDFCSIIKCYRSLSLTIMITQTTRIMKFTLKKKQSNISFSSLFWIQLNTHYSMREQENANSDSSKTWIKNNLIMIRDDHS